MTPLPETYDETLRAFYETLQHTQWMPEDELRAYQRQQLEHMLRHAARTTSFYKDRLAPVVNPDDSINWERWSEIPIVKRSHMQLDRSEMLSKDVPDRHGDLHSISTSGTTGEPVTMTWTSLTTLSRKCANWRMFDWHRLDYSGHLAITRGTDPWPEGMTYDPWGPPWHKNRGMLMTLAPDTPYHRIAEWLGRKRPKYFQALPMTMPTVADHLVTQKIDNPIACMFAYGGQVAPLVRKLVRDALDVPIVEVYSSNDCGQIAHQCEAGSLHILSELALVEIVDDAGQPCPPGVEGRIIVTVLHNSVLPLIRYEIGDVAAFAQSCSCGRTLPVIGSITGRIKNLFRFGDDRPVAPYNSEAYKILAKVMDPTWYQIAQTGPMSVEIRFVSRDELSAEGERFIKEKMPTIWRNAKPEITFNRLDAMPTRPGQKHIVFVNEWEPGVTPDYSEA